MTVEEEAARWFARMQGAAPDHSERSAFEAWLVADPAHSREYASFSDTWNDLHTGIHGEALARAMRERVERLQKSRRSLLRHGSLGLVLSAGVAGAWYRDLQMRPEWQLARRTGTGELARMTLPDGSTLVLGAGTDLAVSYSRTERGVDLRAGSAIFEVDRDVSRPFLVRSGEARITVLGTRFYVDLQEDRLRVGVDHGRVQVDAGPFWRRKQLALAAGQVAELALREGSSSGALELVDRKAADGFAFEHGLLVFDQAGLPEIAQTLSRYRRSPVHVQPPEPGRPQPRIVASIQAADVESFIDALPQAAAVTVQRQGSEVWLQAR